VVKTPKLLDRVREAMRTAHDSLRTEEADLGWIRRFILWQKGIGKRRELGKELGKELVSIHFSAG